ncbi:sensor histidine kinase [Blautia liquoris]|uniref:histidine kinase n=1 Tax=Blautia liquoris TaxID=2779518 RepID=A0A7M2RJ91_9FIRM|nr:histidine kinase [Blautia liquoris]QOV20198.1 sensor histidine kinase [Blautia liquoris]
MHRAIDYAVLIIYCFLLVLFIPVDTSFIAAFLLTVIFTSSIYCIGKKQYSFAAAALYTFLALFFPSLYIFIPVFLYHMLQYELYVPIVVSLLGLCWHLYGKSNEVFFLILFGLLLSFVLQKKTTEYQALKAKFRQTRDDSTELNLLLDHRNKTLLEKQDYEVYTATLRERNRIAREIHDNVGHMLTRSILTLGAVKTVNKQEGLSPLLDTFEQSLNTAMDSIRSSVHDLHDESIDLSEVIKSLISEFTFAPVELEYDMGLDVPKEIKYSFISITKEALTNVARHSNATRVHITMREHPGLYQISIHDNGTKESTAASTGIGILNMRDRVEALQGHMQILREHGFKLFITIPKTYKDRRR